MGTTPIQQIVFWESLAPEVLLCPFCFPVFSLLLSFFIQFLEHNCAFFITAVSVSLFPKSSSLSFLDSLIFLSGCGSHLLLSCVWKCFVVCNTWWALWFSSARFSSISVTSVGIFWQQWRSLHIIIRPVRTWVSAFQWVSSSLSSGIVWLVGVSRVPLCAVRDRQELHWSTALDDQLWMCSAYSSKKLSLPTHRVSLVLHGGVLSQKTNGSPCKFLELFFFLIPLPNHSVPQILAILVYSESGGIPVFKFLNASAQRVQTLLHTHGEKLMTIIWWWLI